VIAVTAADPTLDMRLHVIVSTPTFLPTIGGAELGIHEIYSRLAERHRVTILTPRLRPALLERHGALDYQRAGYEVRHPLPRLERVCPNLVMRVLHRTSISYLIELVRLRLSGRVDVVNFHYIRSHGIALILLRRLLGVPVVLSLVGRTDVVHLLRWPAQVWANVIVANSDAVLPNSEFYLRGTSGEQVDVVPYGVDTAAFSPHRRSAELRSQLGVDDDQFLMLSVQRLTAVKRVDVLIHAMAKIVERDNSAVLVLVGEGDEGQALRRLVSCVGLNHHVRFTGYVSSEDLPSYFASADIFVFHSLLETFGIVFAQAMASGLPIVAANTSCVPDVVHSDNGILVAPFDTDAFCDAVLSLRHDAELRRTIGKRNRTRAEQEFDWDLIADRYEQVLLAATGAKH
jgi:phosphatidylinositol alpha-1,6-mannosyltransferase